MTAIALECYSKEFTTISKRAPRHRRAAMKSSAPIVTKFSNGVAEITSVAAPAPAPTAKPKKAPKAPAAPIASSVPAAPTKAAVTVNGAAHASVFQAFVALGLPVNKHVKFRAELKKAGALTFSHEGAEFLFKTSAA